MKNSDGSLGQAKLWSVYQQQPEMDRYVLRLCSVIYGPVNRNNLLACLNRALPKGAPPLNATHLKRHLDNLIRQQLLLVVGSVGPQCAPIIVELATREAIANGEMERFVAAIQQTIPIRTGYRGGRMFNSRNELLREVRIGLYRNDKNFVAKQIEDYGDYRYDRTFSFPEFLNTVFNNPFDGYWIDRLEGELAEITLKSIFSDSVFKLTPLPTAWDWLAKQVQDTQPPVPPFLQRIYMHQLLIRGQIDTAAAQIDRLDGVPEVTSRGWLQFLRGEDAVAVAALQQSGGTSGRKKSQTKSAMFDTIEGLMLILSLIRLGGDDNWQQALTYAEQVAKRSGHWLQSSGRRLATLLRVKLGQTTLPEALGAGLFEFIDTEHSIGMLVSALCLYWLDREQASKQLPPLLMVMHKQAEAAGYGWIASEALEILARLNRKYRPAADQQQQTLGLATVVGAIPIQEAWEMSLSALSKFGQAEPITPVGSDRRLIWLLQSKYGRFSLEPREQKITAKGDWSKGRPIALKRLLAPQSFGYFTPQDYRICQHIETEYYHNRYGGEVEYSFAPEAFTALVGHPTVFWQDAPQVQVEVLAGEPVLVVQKGEQEITLQLMPKFHDQEGVVLTQETPTKVRVTPIRPEHSKIAALIGDRLQVPAEAEERVLAAIGNIAQTLTVHSDIGGGTAGHARTVVASAQPHIHLLPLNGGLKVSVLVRPFDTAGPYFQPGMGSTIVIAEVDGERLQANRELTLEQQLADKIIQACPTLSQWEAVASEWAIDDPEACLEMLLELQTLEDLAIIEWPEGQKMRIKQQVSSSNFAVNIRRQQDWFEASGQLQIDDEQVLNMRQLMELFSASPGRFLPLGDGEFVALTDNFRQQLEELRAFSHRHGEGVRFHPLAGAAMQGMLGQLEQLTVDEHWRTQVRKLQELPNFQPKVPKTLKADLRDYQQEGFHWLSQLAYWGVGACLADDMGLGKTVQTLAIILSRAKDGPTLILAPTSVCINWLEEAERFAPSLKLHQLGSGVRGASPQENRQQTLERLGKKDVLICSYGLLQQEEVAKLLAEVAWETIVLDEAQAIKNAATKRSQAAMKLQGKFKILTTGTPIENHLGELWNLFQFINPGLLGSLEDFNQRFANAIERQQDPIARERLKRLIQPFILRRTKAQVLAELPPRTEIILHVELSTEEKLFYEALRREALNKLSQSNANAGQKHLQVLAEIMRLRRACCNPQLVQPQMQLASSKLELFGETLAELLDNGHRALVFSQFVDHLTIVRKYLDEQGVSYQYLDGSTPTKDRKTRVAAFQAGEGEVFLISLKAGGTGLNLTAADYVLHLDPWWNPAVEDQASDRAHRIGQQRPVTIYRLVAKDTIEDKIVSLHQHKRDLASSLLEGTEMSGKVSTDELLQLIRGD